MDTEYTHKFLPEYETMQDVNCIVDENEMLLDIKKLIGEYYLATFELSGKSLNISFDNGQKFRISVNEITAKK